MSPPALPSKVKRSKVHHTKSRNGCVTCRIRRLKCDEGKPICSRCQNFGTGHGCGYAKEESLPAKKKPYLLRPRPHSLRRPTGTLPIYPRFSLLSATNPSASVPGDEEERRYFELFREKVAHVICGYFETPFWTRFIPQMRHHEPAIRHEIVALSALFKSSTHLDDSRWRKNNFRKLAFLYQSKALSYLRESLSGDPQTVRLALIASLLFGYFEMMYGNWQTATQQIYSAQKLLKQWQAARKSSRWARLNSAKLPPVVDPEIAPALHRLDMHLITYLAMNPVYSPPFAEDCDGVEEWLGNMPSQFNSLEMASPYTCQITLLTVKALTKSARYRTCIMSSAPLALITNEQTELKEDSKLGGDVVAKWYKAFRPLFHDQDLEVATKEKLGIFHSYICVLTFETMLATSIETEECVFDNFLERFRYIVTSSRSLFRKDKESGIGLMMCLYYSATRCRDSKLRREAIAILREFPSRNGIWDSLVCAEVANWVADLEGEGSNKEGAIPEWARVRTHTLKWTTDGGRINVECLQGMLGDKLKSRKATLEIV